MKFSNTYIVTLSPYQAELLC